LLGIVMTILGALLAARSWRPHLLSSTAGGPPANPAERNAFYWYSDYGLTFGVVLVGHGLPFLARRHHFDDRRHCLPAISAAPIHRRES